MTIARHASPWRWLLVGAVAVIGIAASLIIGALLRDQAEETWLKRAERDATDATAAIDGWIKEAELQIRGVAGSLTAARRTSTETFTETARRIDEWSDDVSLDAIAFARRVRRHGRAALIRELDQRPTVADHPNEVAPDAFESFVVTLTTQNDGLLRHGSDLITVPATAEAVFSAFRNPGQVVSGPALAGPDDQLFVLLAIKAVNREHSGVAAGVVNLSELINGAINLHAPRGLTLRFSERETESSANTVRRRLIGTATAPPETLATIPLRLATGQARWEFLWDVGPGFRGGPRGALATVIQFGGTAFSLLVTLLLGLSVTSTQRISERVARTVEELRESERGLTDALEASPIGVSITAPEGILIWVNSHMARLLGVTTDDLIDSSPDEFFVDPADRRILIDQMRRDGSVRDFEAHFERPDGSRLWALISVQQIQFRGELARISLVLDITQIKSTQEDALRTSRLLKLTLETMDQGLIVRDAEDHILLFNDKISDLLDVPREMYDRDPSSADMFAYHKAANHFAGVNAETTARVERWFAKKSAGEPVDHLVYERRGPDDRWLLVTHLPMPDGLEARTFIDITERKQAEEARREILEAIPVPLILSRLESVEILFANSVAHALYGISTGDNDRDRITNLYVDQDARREMFRRLKEDGYVDEFEFELMPTPGERIWVLGYARILNYHGEPAALVVTQPITERKRLEQAVAERSELLQTVLDHMGHGLLMFDSDRRLIVSNRRFSRMYDLEQEVLKAGVTQEDLTRLTIERHWSGDPSAMEARLKLAMAWAHDRNPSRQELSRPDGRVFVRDFHGLPDGGAVITHTDLTEVKQAQAEAEQALANLKAAQASLVQSEKLASLGQLVAGIAHEIKNPLNFVNNFSSVSHALLAELKEVLAENSGARSADTQEEIDDIIDNLSNNLAKITEHGTRADTIIKTMLLHARGSDRRQQTRVNALLEEAINLAYHGERATHPGFNVTIERDLDPDAGSAWFVQQEISRVIINLLNNAFHAVGERAKSIDDPDFRPAIAVTSRGLEDIVEIRIGDNGTGMTDHVKENLFTPFFTTKKGTEGTGLGLSLSYDIVVRQHHGTITVESQMDSHTEFTIRLPRERVTPTTSAQQATGG